MTKVTYGQLDRVLRSLGFSGRVVTSEKRLREYDHPATGAWISLAYQPDRKAVLPHHMAMVKGTLDVFGIADPLNFAAELQKAS